MWRERTKRKEEKGGVGENVVSVKRERTTTTTRRSENIQKAVIRYCIEWLANSPALRSRALTCWRERKRACGVERTNICAGKREREREREREVRKRGEEKQECI